jgi:RNA polymerase sigma-70 factor (ECF subfamily)
MALRLAGRFQKMSDSALLTLYLEKRDMEVLGVLYERYMQLVYGVCLKYLKNREDAGDAVINIYEKLLTELDRHEVGDFRPWLYVLTKNYCLMKLRADGAARRKLGELKTDAEFFMESSAEMHPLDRDNGLSDKALEDCIKSLKKEQMNCIRLFYYEDKCYREIAEVLELDEKKVKSHLQNAKRNLKLCLEKGNE